MCIFHNFSINITYSFINTKVSYLSFQFVLFTLGLEKKRSSGFKFLVTAILVLIRNKKCFKIDLKLHINFFASRKKNIKDLVGLSGMFR